MSFLDRIKSVPSQPLLAQRDSSGINGVTLAGFAVDKAERYGASLGYGFLKGYYREKVVFGGVGVDLISGAALTLVSAGLQIATGGSSKIAPHAERIGDAGVQSYLNSIGASMGAKAAKRKVIVVDENTPKNQLPPNATEWVGELPPVSTNASFLTSDEIARYTSPR